MSNDRNMIRDESVEKTYEKCLDYKRKEKLEKVGDSKKLKIEK